MRKFVLYLPVVLALNGCVFVPVTSEKQRFSEDCSMATRMLTLEPKYLGGSKSSKGDGDHNHMSGDEIKAMLLVSGVVASASAIVSGSLVMLGNTIHWLEHKASC